MQYLAAAYSPRRRFPARPIGGASSGVVADPSRAVVSGGATVTISDKPANETLTLFTSKTGAYSAMDLEPTVSLEPRLTAYGINVNLVGNINLVGLEPRDGRTFETNAEEPVLAGKIQRSFAPSRTST